MELYEQIERAYKKLKSNIYYDKTQLILREKIVEYETNYGSNLGQRFKEIADILNGEEDVWNDFEKDILKSIEMLYFPKKLKKDSSKIIINSDNTEVNIDEIQNFISMDIEGQLLGVLWILYIGTKIDENIYEHSYGNRLRNNIYEEEKQKTNFSPNLFKPYFTQYESWRDIALDYAQNKLKNNEDVIILTMDFKRYYYSVNIHKKLYERLEKEYLEYVNLSTVTKRVHNFIFNVIEKYSEEFTAKSEYYCKNVLPIGFLPSNILANWYLSKFDDAIINRWNPVYYGRYVDDIILVDKVEKNSEIYAKAKNNKLTQKDIIKYYLCNCNALKNDTCPNERGLLIWDNLEQKYEINPDIMEDKASIITIQDNKVRLFYFKHGYSDALITCFRKEIAKNKSEFRYMPEDENVLKYDDYSEIFELSTDDTVNKLRGVKGIDIDKFALSKFLGKYLRIGTLIKDKKESKFEKDIDKIFDSQVIISNYTLWEKVIEIFVINNKLEAALSFIIQILHAIQNSNFESKDTTNKIKKTLLRNLSSAVNRSFSINWGERVKNVIKKLESEVKRFDFKGMNETVRKMFFYQNILKNRRKYCISRMCDKNALPILIDCIFDFNKFDKFDDTNEFNLTNFQECLKKAENLEWKQEGYFYYPYIISPQDLEISLFLSSIQKSDKLIAINKLYKETNSLFYKLNFGEKSEAILSDISIKLNAIGNKERRRKGDKKKNLDIYAIKVGNKKYKKCKIAVANTKLQYEDFEKVLKGFNNRSYERYERVKDIINEAIKCNTKILIMPEAYLPFEWVPIISRICAKTQMAIVTGIEHIQYEKSVYNLTAIILPYEAENYSFSHIFMHDKVHYSPEEKLSIRSYGFNEIEGEAYELFVWNDVWFPVYCCFELSSIKDRALFQSYSDFLIAVEWNKDINYYSNIIESLDRDLHCYCAQVNTSEYGDSRIVKPSQTSNKDILRTKGGENATVLVGNIDIRSLREFQIKGYELQKCDKRFKPTPPEFDVEVVRKKIQGVLWQEL